MTLVLFTNTKRGKRGNKDGKSGGYGSSVDSA